MLAFVLLFTLVASPAFAHTSNTNAPVFEQSGAVIWGQPFTRWVSATRTVEWDRVYNCPTAEVIQSVYVTLHWLDEDGAQIGATFDAGTTSIGCSGTPRLFEDHQFSTAPTGAANAVIAGAEIIYSSQSGGAGTRYMRTKTMLAGEPPGAPQNLEVVEMGKGGQVLSYDHVAALAIRAGFSKSESITMTAVAKAESSFRTAAVSYIGCCGGLWQINFEVHPVTKTDTFDPYINSQWARKIFLSQGLQAWEAYTNGAYSQFMDEAAAAVERQWSTGQPAYVDVRNAPAASDGYVTLGWDEVEGAESYTVQRSSDSGQTWGQVGTPTTRTFTDSNVTVGSTYRYRVKACNDSGCSDWSGEVEVTIGEYDPDGDASVPGTPIGQTPGDDVDPDGVAEQCKEAPRSSNCGLSILCAAKAALRWAFVPGQATCEAWAGFNENLGSRPPFSIIHGSGAAAVEFLTRAKDRYEFVTSAGMEDQIATLCRDLGLDENGAQAEFGEHDEVCFGAALKELADGNDLVASLRTMAHFIIMIAGVFAVWRILRSGLTNAPDPKAAEVMDDDVEDEGAKKA